MITESPTIVEALFSLVPNAKFTLRGTDYSGLEWADAAAKPSQAEVDAELIRLQTEWDAQEYARNRATEYPSTGDQLDYIYHNGVAKWKTDMIDPVKMKYPKG